MGRARGVGGDGRRVGVSPQGQTEHEQGSENAGPEAVKLDILRGGEWERLEVSGAGRWVRMWLRRIPQWCGMNLEGEVQHQRTVPARERCGCGKEVTGSRVQKAGRGKGETGDWTPGHWGGRQA